MVKQLINKELFKKGDQIENSSIFAHLIELTNQLFETPFLSISCFENPKLHYNYLQGIRFEELPDVNPFANYCIRKKNPLIISDFSNKDSFNVALFKTPYSQFIFYAGIPFINEFEEVIGVFEIADFVSRDFSEKQLNQLKLIAKQIHHLLDIEGQLNSWGNDLLAYSTSSNILFCFIDKSFKIKSFNKLFEKFIHINFDESLIKGENILKFIPEENQNAFSHHIAMAFDGDDSEIEQIKYYEGIQGLWIDSFTGIKDLNNKFVGVAIRSREVTVEKNKIKESETNLLTIFNHAPTAMLIARPDDGLIVMVNKELRILAEADEVDLIGMYTTDFYAHNFERDLFLSIMHEKGAVKNLELRIKKKDGTIANCLVSSEKIIWKGEKMLLSGFIDISDRKKSELLLVQNEERFRSLYNRTPVMLHSLNQNGDFVSVSDYWLAKLGYQRMQIIGKNISDFFTKASYKDSIKVRIPELIKRGYDFDIPYQVIKRNGEVMDVLVSTIVEKSPDQNEIRYLAVMQDVTERKRIDEALQQSEDNLRTIFENTNIGYALLDADLFIVSFNSMMQKFAQEDLHKTLYLHTFSVLYFSEARQPGLAAALKSVLDGETISYEINYIQPDASDRWYKMSMFPVFNKKSVASGIVMVVEDINESKLKEIHLSKVVKEITDYKLALDESSIVMITDEKGFITYANENCLKATEYSLEELLGKNLNFLESGYHSEAFFADMWKTIENGNIWKGEIRNKNSSEHYFWVDCTIVPFVDINKKIYQYIAIQRDITQTKNAEFELNKSFSLVNEQNKRLLNFSYIVSHNLRSHTSNIISILNFLEKEDTVAEKGELLQHLKRVSLSLNDTLYNLNEVVSIRNNINMVIEPLNLREYILQALGILSEQIIQKNVLILNEVPENTLVNYNPAYLESVVLNFISNAIKYSSPERQPRIELTVSYEGEDFIFKISDNGIGIDMKKNGDKLFGMYKTFNNNPDARGIGLFITKNQIDAMGGKVEVESEPGKGTSFKIYFAK